MDRQSIGGETAGSPGARSGEGRQDLVTITVNGAATPIHHGRQSVSAIKEAAGVPLADVLVQVVDGQLKPLDDSGAVTIKGDEQFVSHPRDSGSSHA